MDSDLQKAFRYHMRKELNQACAAPRGRAPFWNRFDLATRAIAAARLDVINGRRRYPCPIKPYPAAGAADERGLRVVESPEANGFRFVGRASVDGRRGAFSDRAAEGWLTDPDGVCHSDGTGLCWGVVYQVPGRAGQSRFVAGYVMGEMDGAAVLDLSCTYDEPAAFWEPVRAGGYGGYWSYVTDPKDMDSARDAARAADSMAQNAAEREQEYQAAWRAGSQWADMKAEESAIRKEILSDIADLKMARREGAADSVIGDDKASKFARLCEIVRSDISERLEMLQESRRKRADLVDNARWNKDAFCDGASVESFPC